jgi:hypothetical protein
MFLNVPANFCDKVSVFIADAIPTVGDSYDLYFCPYGHSTVEVRMFFCSGRPLTDGIFIFISDKRHSKSPFLFIIKPRRLVTLVMGGSLEDFSLCCIYINSGKHFFLCFTFMKKIFPANKKKTMDFLLSWSL